MKRVVCLVLVLLLLGSACAFAQVTITYNDWCAIDPAWAACYESLFNKFDEMYGDEIKLEAYGTIASQTRQQILMEASAGTNQDCAKIKTEWLKELVDMGVLADLGQLLPQEVLDDYKEGVLEGYTFDGKLYAIAKTHINTAKNGHGDDAQQHRQRRENQDKTEQTVPLRHAAFPVPIQQFFHCPIRLSLGTALLAEKMCSPTRKVKLHIAPSQPIMPVRSSL